MKTYRLHSKLYILHYYYSQFITIIIKFIENINLKLPLTLRFSMFFYSNMDFKYELLNYL